MPLVWIFARLTDSLHPGNAEILRSEAHMDNGMRMIFYPAIIGHFFGCLDYLPAFGSERLNQQLEEMSTDILINRF
jgi:hypothetical protein